MYDGVYVAEAVVVTLAVDVCVYVADGVYVGVYVADGV